MTNQSVKLDPSADAKSIVTTPKGVYTWSLLGADGRPYAPSLVLTRAPVGCWTRMGGLPSAEKKAF